MKKWMLLALFAAPAMALQVGQSLPYITLDDQFGQSHQLSAPSGVLLFTDSRSAGSMATESMNQVDAAQLQQLNYLVDVSGMPSMITKLFAVPKWKELSYPVLIDQQGDATANLPSEPDSVSMLCVEQGKLKEVRYYSDGESLLTALKAPWCQ